MNNRPSTSKQSVSLLEDDEVFEDSTILANFNNSSFRDSTNRVSENNVNDSFNKSGLNVSALCCDEEISGYDKLTGKTWIYPTNYPVRDYQFNIIKAAILNNTLVSLPTGLGKTFIAAVIMYNFYRWYPLGKIIFLAPTRPLVAQQIDACYNIVAIPPGDTIEMTGHMQVNTRKTHWQSKRVIFATPQVVYNDIKSGICPANLIRCLVFDEAHRARGNYAYCQIVGTLTDMGMKTYRVLALSATPGSKVDDVIQVVKSLHIAHLELRTENCIDVAPYSHSRQVNTVIIPLGPELTQLRQGYVEIMDDYARRLKQLNILPHNLGNLSKGRIVMLYKEFQTKDRSNRHPQHNFIMKDFTILIALYHGLELLTKHGSRVFLNFFDEHPEKTWIQSDDRLTMLLERLRDDLGVNPLSLDRSILPDGTIPEIPKDLCFGHPKFIRLKEIMLDHFKRSKDKGQDTRAIVFCEYRESVNLVHCLLLQCRPLILPQMFVGQGASGKDGKTVVSQKQQLRVMRNFREGGCNVLVATCVAEEGLDVGSVDLIVCFDISTRSPVRLVQRCGRTGRERGGQVYILVTEGREHQTLLDCMRQRDGLNKKIQQSKEVASNLYAANPRMVPRGFVPQCQKMYITVTGTAAQAKGQKDLRTMLLGRASSSSSGSGSSNILDANVISEDEFKQLYPEGYKESTYFEPPKEYWNMSKETFKELSSKEQPYIKLSTWLEWQRTLQSTVNIGHSKDSEILSDLLQYSDAKRFELPPSTQHPSFDTQDFTSQKIIPSPKKLTTTNVSSPAKVSSNKPKQTKKKQKIPLIRSPSKKDGDIRALFSIGTKSTKSYTKLINELGIKNDGSIPTSLINLLVDLNLNVNNNETKKCYVCANICDCAFLKKLKPNKGISPTLKLFLKEPKLPELDLIEDMNVETILQCQRKDLSIIDTHNDQLSMLADNKDVRSFDLDDQTKDIRILDTQKEEVSLLSENKDVSKNFDLEFDFDSPIDLTSPEGVEIKDDQNIDKNFDLGNIEDMFADSSPEEAIVKENDELNEKDSSNPKEALGFFGLHSIDDIFADSDDSINNNTPKTPTKDDRVSKVTLEKEGVYKTSEKSKNKQTLPPSPIEYPLSPSILSGKVKKAPSSPILSSQARKFKLSTKKKEPKSSTPISNTTKRVIMPDIKKSISPREKSKSNVMQTSEIDNTSKSMLTITQLVDIINKTGDKSDLSLSKSKTVEEKQIVIDDDERSTSPILLTQADKKKIGALNSSKNKTNTSSTNRKAESLIILESDSDSENEQDTTQVYNVDDKITEIQDSQKLKTPEKTSEVIMSPYQSPVRIKRMLSFEDDELSESPYFNKRRKTEACDKTITLQQKVLAALSSNKNKTNINNERTDINNDRTDFNIDKTDFNNDNMNFNNDANINFMSPIGSPILPSQKENKNPQFLDIKTKSPDILQKEEYIRKSNLEMLQMFRKDSQTTSPKSQFDSLRNTPRQSEISKRKLIFEDSDDDFVDAKGDKNERRQKLVNGHRKNGTITNHKVRKKKPKKLTNSFLDLEADQSDDQSVSGDELSDDSVGSIVDFICNDNVTHREDMQALYMRSVKSPVKGVFKIPQLPKKFQQEEVFSQFVEEDHYEMDSFCVDSHIGLTQANDMTELEVAEMLLEQRRGKKKKNRVPAVNTDSSEDDNGDSPLVRKKRNVRRKIDSDSDED